MVSFDDFNVDLVSYFFFVKALLLVTKHERLWVHLSSFFYLDVCACT